VLTRIDRYVVNRFSRTVAFALAAFLVVYVVVDLIDHLDDFFSREVALSDIVRYYGNYAPYILVLTLPVAVLLATLFVIGDMGGHNELVAISAAGISVYRVALPLLRLGLLLSLAALLLTELVVPGANDERSRILQLAPQGILSGHAFHVCRQDRSGLILYAERYNIAAKRAQRVAIVQLRGGVPVRRIDASEMVWDDLGWQLQSALDRSFLGDSMVFASREAMRLPLLTIQPEDLARVDKLPEQMSFLELRDYIRRTRLVGGDASRWLVDLHLKFAFPFANLMMVWIGFPLAARSWRGGRAAYVGLTFLVGFLYFVVVRSGQALGRSGDLHPVVAAWGANALFFVIGAALFRWSRK